MCGHGNILNLMVILAGPSEDFSPDPVDKAVQKRHDASVSEAIIRNRALCLSFSQIGCESVDKVSCVVKSLGKLIVSFYFFALRYFFNTQNFTITEFF
jgi:hypothetical protein